MDPESFLNRLTPEEQQDFFESMEEIKNEQLPVDIEDIGEAPPELKEALDQYNIKNASRDEMNTLLANLAKSYNFINPNDNRFSQYTEEELPKARLREKLRQKKNSRTTKYSKKCLEEKKQKKKEEALKRQQENIQKEIDAQHKSESEDEPIVDE